MKVVRKKILDLFGVLNKLSDKTGPISFVAFVAKNKLVLTPEMEVIQKIFQVKQEDEKYQKYQTEKTKILDKYSSGKTKANNLGEFFYTFEDDKLRKKAEKEIEALDKKNIKIIEGAEKRNNEIKEFLDEEITVPELSQISMDKMPDGLLTVNDVQILMDFDLLEI